MKKIAAHLIINLIACTALAQNLPQSGGISGPPEVTTISGSITNTVTLPSAYSLGSSPLYNYVRVFLPQTPVTDASAISETAASGYLGMGTVCADGFGRKLQTIIRHSSPGNDIVIPYDNRPSGDHFSYLPYTINTAGCNTFQMSPFADQASYYNSLYPAEPGMAIGESSYTSDADSRVQYSFAPGKSNLGQENGVRTSVMTNIADEVIIWQINASPPYYPQKIGYYAPGTLVKKVTESADGAQIFEYYDNEGKLIAKNVLSGFSDCDLTVTTASVGSLTAFRMYNPTEDPTLLPAGGTAPGAKGALNGAFSSNAVPYNYFSPFQCPTYLLSYYVYDVYDRLTYTLPPKAVQYLYTMSWVPNATVIENLCDYTIYDNYGRVTTTHQAGENGTNQIIYDSHNRIAATRKPNDGLWWWNHYDHLNRIIETGTINLSPTTYPQATIQSYFDNGYLPGAFNTPVCILYYLYNESQQGIYPSALASSIPTAINSYNFYDDYTHTTFYDGTSTVTMGLPGYDASVFSGYTATGATAVAPVQSANTRGMLTGSVSKVFTNSSITTLNNYVFGNVYYDDRGRAIESIDQNAKGGIDHIATQYDFTGKPLVTIEIIKNLLCTANPVTTSVTQYQYNIYTQTLSQITNSINGSTSRAVVGYDYNDLGKVADKIIGAIEYQGLAYNIRGQLTGKGC